MQPPHQCKGASPGTSGPLKRTRLWQTSIQFGKKNPYSKHIRRKVIPGGFWDETWSQLSLFPLELHQEGGTLQPLLYTGQVWATAPVLGTSNAPGAQKPPWWLGLCRTSNSAWDVLQGMGAPMQRQGQDAPQDTCFHAPWHAHGWRPSRGNGKALPNGLQPSKHGTIQYWIILKVKIVYCCSL